MFSALVTMGSVGLILQGVTVLLGGFSAFYIWRQLKILALTGQAQVSENLASKSIDILRHLAGTSHHYEYFYENRPFQGDGPDRTYVLCSAEIVANFLEHIVLQRDSLPLSSREAWLQYVRDHYESSRVVRDFIADHKEWYAKVFLDFVSMRSRGSSHRPSPAPLSREAS